MAGICGWIGYGETQDANRALIERMSEPLRRHAAAMYTAHADKSGALACASSKRVHHVYQTPEWCIAIDGVPTLKLRGTTHAQPVQALGELLRSEGVSALANLSGSFALAFVDFKSGSAMLAVDRNATHSLSYTTISNALIFGSNLDSTAIHPLVKPELDPQSIYNYLYFHMVPGPRTIYRNHQRLRPGEYVEFRNGVARLGNYWKNGFSEEDSTAFPQLKEQFLDVLRTGVGDNAKDINCGAFLSGGTDSSTLAGLLTQLRSEPAHTYSIGFDSQGYDEMDYARIAVRHFGTDHHEYYVTADDIVTAVPAIAAIYDQPFGNSSAVPTYFCAKLAREDGRDLILGGDGGDELFGGNVRYAKQRVFEHYHALPGALRTGVIEPIAGVLPSAVMPLRKIRSYVDQARVPMPERLETYNLLERFGPLQVFEADFLASIDRGDTAHLMRAAYEGTNARSMINKMLALDHQFTLADNDLPKVTKMCELAGIDVAFPFLHDDVVAFAARLRPELKLKGNKLRYFFKEALRGFLPDAIITKQKHGFGLPFGPWLAQHKGLQALVHDSLASLRKRHIVRPEFLSDLTDAKVAEHPGYYGTMVWVMMMLELWFQSHRDVRA